MSSLHHLLLIYPATKAPSFFPTSSPTKSPSCLFSFRLPSNYRVQNYQVFPRLLHQPNRPVTLRLILLPGYHQNRRVINRQNYRVFSRLLHQLNHPVKLRLIVLLPRYHQNSPSHFHRANHQVIPQVQVLRNLHDFQLLRSLLYHPHLQFHHLEIQVNTHQIHHRLRLHLIPVPQQRCQHLHQPAL